MNDPINYVDPTGHFAIPFITDIINNLEKCVIKLINLITGFQFIPANYTPILKDERSVISRSVDIPVKIDSFMCFVDM